MYIAGRRALGGRGLVGGQRLGWEEAVKHEYQLPDTLIFQ